MTLFLYRRVQRSGSLRVVKIVATAKPVAPGTTLTATDLMLIDWPAKVPIEGSFSKPEDVIGRIVVYPVGNSAPVSEQMLASPGSAIGLTAKIPDGMRAMAVETNDVNNVSGFVFPGARVDVLVTVRPDNGHEPMTATVLQNVLVLSTGERLEPDPSGKPQKVREVTMLLTPDDAQKLVLGTNQGTLQFVLRNGADQEKADHHPVTLKDLEVGAAAPAAAPTVRKAAAPAKPPAGYEVETFDGSKRSVVKF